MKRLGSVLMAALFAAACGQGVPQVEEGVSEALAQFRKETVSDVSYTLEFSIPDSLHSPVTGRETLQFSLEKRVPVQLDFRGEKLLSLTVNGTEIAPECTLEHIILPRAALVGGLNTVEMTFVSGDRSLNRSEEYLYTLFVPDRARTVFPCFDQPDLKASFELSLEIPSSWVAVSCGSKVSETMSEGRKHLVFKKTAPLSTYLFAFSAGRWQVQTRYRGDEPMSVYYRETDPSKTAQIDDIFDQVRASLDWLEEYTGIARPFEKYDFVIVPGFQFGGMEHPGCILFNDKRMFLSAAPTTPEKLSRIELIAHETSHLWFGDAVTMRWFNDVWTKEVYANYFAAQISGPMFPEVNAPLRDFRNFTIPAWAEDRTAGTNAIRRPLDNLSRAGLIYGNIVYDKAPVVMRMLSDLLGSGPFRDGIREYLGKFMYGNATWDDLVAVLDSHTDLDLAAWSKVWVSEKGMPVIKYCVSDDMLTVTQEDPFGRSLVWPQYITFGDASGAVTKRVWCDAASVSVPLGDDASVAVLFPNMDALAYGRFILDQDIFDAGIQALADIGGIDRRRSCVPDRPESRLSLMATLLANRTLGPEALARAIAALVQRESDPLVASAGVSYLRTMSVHGSLAGNPLIENSLRDIADNMALAPEIRLQAFRALVGIFRSDGGLWDAFEKAQGYKGLVLSTRDYINMAYQLALRYPSRYERIREMEEARLAGSADLLREFRYIYRAATPSKPDRDRLFEELLEPSNRAVEPWAASALYLLNHPLRQSEALDYIIPALAELPEIQRTGDIFFPKDWAVSLLEGHNSPEAAAMVKAFLATNPDFPPMLKDKLLQSADHLLSLGLY